MTTKEQLLKEIEQASESLVEEVFGFLISVKARHNENDLVQPDPDPKRDRPSKPIWEIAQELTQDMTVEEIAQLPKDGAEQHDHYIYGIPKRQE
ncbi:MAG: hypothetical protein HC772_20485 [Leptolyngbyaceae cyanobacterium CRU_2_3]|nr:hypothetical protein [Leptolyngbyaceae cyanobacterium CRU_2_3]